MGGPKAPLPPPLDPRLGQGGGCPPCPDGKKMEIRKCLDDLDAKHIFNFKIVKIGPNFFRGGGGGTY